MILPIMKVGKPPCFPPTEVIKRLSITIDIVHKIHHLVYCHRMRVDKIITGHLNVSVQFDFGRVG